MLPLDEVEMRDYMELSRFFQMFTLRLSDRSRHVGNVQFTPWCEFADPKSRVMDRLNDGVFARFDALMHSKGQSLARW